jgi:hypothetical protein
MKSLPHLCAILWLLSFLAGCETTRRFFAAVNNLAVGVYKATPQQAQVADQRATAIFEKFSVQEKMALKETGTRYLAVRTSDPTPAQWTEIRKDMQKPSSRYFGGGAKAPSKVYCVMIWDTQSRQIVGTDCYDVLKLPPAGELARFDTYTAQYVGTF